MPSVQRLLEDRLAAAIRAAFPEAAQTPAVVMPAQDERFGDYQANGAMALAKRLGKKPRDVAAAIVAAADLAGIADPPEIAGPGFINLRLSAGWLAGQLAGMLGDKRLGVPCPARRRTIVVDYSAPNLAKEMHVGHLRSTIIGDALVRILDFLGHTVIRQNHVGDWGTQFGTVTLGIWHICMAQNRGDPGYIERTWKLLAGIKKDDPKRVEALHPIRDRHRADLDADRNGKSIFEPFLERVKEQSELSLADLLPAYQLVNLIESLAEGTDLTIVRTPDGKVVPYSSVSSWAATMVQHPEIEQNVQEKMAWEYARNLTLDACQVLYNRLGIQLTRNDVRGESAYNDVLRDIVEALDQKGLLVESQGAQCVFLKDAEGKPLFAAKDGSPLPLIVQKSDEGYLYATTDLAAVAFRTGNLPGTAHPESEIRNANSPRADRILYVTDARQSLHFRMMFAAARAAGFAPPEVSLEHVAFGMMMGSDNRPFKTREGGTVKLMDLLDEAERRALDLVTRKNTDDVAADRAEALSADEKKSIARVVGIGALKYADLSQNRTKDYVFSWDKMLALDGNTAPYMQYACARINSIARRGGLDLEALMRGPASGEGFMLAEPAERRLALALLQFAETVETVADDCVPHVLCGYLYRLAGAFMGFYETCPVLKADEPLRTSRLGLCGLTARVIAKGLDLLGIETAERM